MLKYAVTWLFLLACLSANASDDKQSLTTLLDEFLAGASTNDAGMHDRFWSSELIYTSSSGGRFGKDEIMAGVNAQTPSQDATTTRYWAEDVDIRLHGDFAIVAFRLMAESTGSNNQEADSSQYFNTGTFMRKSDGWKAIAWQATRIPQAGN